MLVAQIFFLCCSVFSVMLARRSTSVYIRALEAADKASRKYIGTLQHQNEAQRRLIEVQEDVIRKMSGPLAGGSGALVLQRKRAVN